MRTKADPSALSTSKSDGHSGTARLHDLASKYMDLGEKMSVMVVRDGESISYKSASEGSTNSPLYEILTKLIHKTRSAHRSKKTRISFVAKDDDLKLLSDDPEVQVVDSVSIQESQRMDDLFASSDNVNDGIAEVSVHENNKATQVEYIDDGQTPTILEKTPAHYCGIDDNDLHCSDTEMEEQQAVEASDVSPDLREEAPIDVHGSNEVHDKLQKHRDEKIVTEVLDILKPDGRKANSNKEKSGPPNQQNVFSVLSQESERIENFISEDDLFNIDEESEKSDSKYSPRATFSSSSILASDNTEYTEQVTSSISDNQFVGSFFFSDGGNRLLRTLTGGSRMPSLVIIDPVQQKHYVFPQESEFSYPSLAIFFDSFVNRSLSPYYRSASSVVSSKELPRPPLFNQDFHEANSIPLLTASSFCRLVFGFEGCDSKNETPFLNTATLGVAWKKDVLVLFSNSWCGFCQRTELVVRELHRSFKSYMSLNSQFAKAQGLQTEENGGDLGLPTIYMMDCTANDCHHLLKSADKEELYPTVLLFPAENKSAISYGGGMSVGNLIEFLESHASNSRHMSVYKGWCKKQRLPLCKNLGSAKYCN
uniref:Thioredoxin domain-containing protein n=1 Tax=Aegilops tauschii subsp. strangulata TaxID=200361 RepID=A0A452YGV7_AEGTS